MKSGIYLIKNIENKKVYIGSAINIPKRWTEHKRELKEGKHHSCLLQRAWNKYGEQSFKFEILEEVSNPQYLLAYEQVYLDYYKSYEIDKGYNICKIAGSTFGVKHTEEVKQKMSEAAKNMSEEKRRKIREAMTGRILSEEHKKKISEGNKGRIVSEETRQKIGKANKNTKLSEEVKQRLREINTGKKHSEETKRKIREGNKGKIVSEETKRKIGEANKGRQLGRKHSQETKNKISEALKGKK